MKLVIKQLKKIVKKVDRLEQTIYQCVLEGADPSGTSIVFGKVTLETDDPDNLNDIVRQEIDAEVDIKFFQPQATLERFVEQGGDIHERQNTFAQERESSELRPELQSQGLLHRDQAGG